MKLICNGNELSDAVGKVIKATAIRSTNPILEGIKLKAEDECLTLTATDLELAIEKKIKADVKIEGEIVVAGRFFSEFVKKLTNEQIEISKSDANDTIVIKYTDSEGVLQSMPVNEFPELKKIENPEIFKLKQNDFREIIDKTIFSAAYDDTRPILKGILVEIADKKITAIALDGYRMAICSKQLKESSASLSFIVPARSLAEVSKILDQDEEDLTIYVQKNYIMLEINNYFRDHNVEK